MADSSFLIGDLVKVRPSKGKDEPGPKFEVIRVFVSTGQVWLEGNYADVVKVGEKPPAPPIESVPEMLKRHGVTE
jgi:hypothetical protein